MISTTLPRAPRPPAPAKIRILETADGLFYTQGIHTVGVDKIIGASHVTKATFYKHYRSKDRLIVAYVEGRDARTREYLASLRHTLPDAAAVLRALADGIAAEAIRDGFHGCPFINAAAQFTDPENPVRVAVSEHRAWYRTTLAEIATELGHPRPGDAADDFLLARDGALCGGNVGDAVAAGKALHRVVDRLIAEA